jgi:hypothetical protein
VLSTYARMFIHPSHPRRGRDRGPGHRAASPNLAGPRLPRAGAHGYTASVRTGIPLEGGSRDHCGGNAPILHLDEHDKIDYDETDSSRKPPHPGQQRHDIQTTASTPPRDSRAAVLCMGHFGSSPLHTELDQTPLPGGCRRCPARSADERRAVEHPLYCVEADRGSEQPCAGVAGVGRHLWDGSNAG